MLTVAEAIKIKYLGSRLVEELKTKDPTAFVRVRSDGRISVIADTPKNRAILTAATLVGDGGA